MSRVHKCFLVVLLFLAVSIGVVLLLGELPDMVLGLLWSVCAVAAFWLVIEFTRT